MIKNIIESNLLKILIALVVILTILSIFLATNLYNQIEQYKSYKEEVKKQSWHTLSDTTLIMIEYSKGEQIDYETIYLSTKFINESKIIEYALRDTEYDWARIANLFAKLQGLAGREEDIDNWNEILEILTKFTLTLSHDPDVEDIEENKKYLQELYSLLPQ